ncbi:MAG: hypothetical protein ABIQ32_04425 [Sphingomicrobium sp.]
METFDWNRYPDMILVGGGEGMAVDEVLRAELVEARERILAQLGEIEFRSTAKGFGRHGGGPPAYGQVYTELKEQLRQLNELLVPIDGGERPAS